jgi:hypothetical protein
LSDDDIKRMIIYEIVLKSIPNVLFILTALIRYYEVKSIGFARVSHYSIFFILKIGVSCFMAFLNFMLILLSFTMNPNWKQSIWTVKADLRFLSLVYLLEVFAWTISAFLLAYEYKKRLSEAYYSH